MVPQVQVAELQRDKSKYPLHVSLQKGRLEESVWEVPVGSPLSCDGKEGVYHSWGRGDSSLPTAGGQPSWTEFPAAAGRDDTRERAQEPVSQVGPLELAPECYL